MLQESVLVRQLSIFAMYEIYTVSLSEALERSILSSSFRLYWRELGIFPAPKLFGGAIKIISGVDQAASALPCPFIALSVWQGASGCNRIKVCELSHGSMQSASM